MNLRILTSRGLPLAVAAAALTLSAACADDPAGPGEPTMATVAGDYSAGGSFGALSFTTTSGAETVDWLALGADLTLELNAAGEVTGRLYIPVPDDERRSYFEEEDQSRGYMEENMAGTWTLGSSTVRFEQSADTFVRDMDFVYADHVLTGEETFSGVTIRIVLVKQ